MQWARTTVVVVFPMSFFDNTEVHKTVLMTVECGENYSGLQVSSRMTTVFKLHPEFCRRNKDKGTDSDFDKVITDLAKVPGSPSGTVMKIQYEMKIDSKAGSHNLHSDMNDRDPGTFHAQCMKSEYVCLDQHILQTLTCLQVASPQGRVVGETGSVRGLSIVSCSLTPI